MKNTRRHLIGINTQLQAQIAACSPESRQKLRARLASTRAELEVANKQIKSLTEKLQGLEAAIA